MNDLTTAQLVKRLRDQAGDYGLYVQTIATSHEKDWGPMQQSVWLAAEHIEQQTEQIARLRKVIENAPHQYECYTYWGDEEGHVCTCWKSRASTERETR